MSPAERRHASLWVWSWPSLTVVVTVFLLITFGPWLGVVEGAVAPVTSKITLTNVQERDHRTYFVMNFEKFRNCELKGITVRRKGVSVVAGPAKDDSVTGTISTGPRRSQLWFVEGGLPVDDMEILWSHSCSFLWTTVTAAYP